jgi:hypothetical protein
MAVLIFLLLGCVSRTYDINITQTGADGEPVCGNAVTINLMLEGLKIDKPIDVTTDAKATVIP